MKNIKRYLSIDKDVQKKSILLLGPRQTGKTTYLSEQIKFDKVYNLLHADVYTRLLQDPSFLRRSLKNSDKMILIDEIQKLPLLMDEVHALIEEKKIKFVLTGSSARKLYRTHTSLAGGRLRVRYMFPFVSEEVPNYNLNKVLQYGLIPPIYLSEEPEKDLADYVGTYLKEEIAAEAFARNIENFSRFLKKAAFYNTRQINYESIGQESQVPARTVHEYFQVLEDTLIGTTLRPIKYKTDRKLTTKPKFYFFDMGIVNTLKRIQALAPETEPYGECFEQFIFNEIKAYLSYNNKIYDNETIQFWRTQRGEYEVDFIIDSQIAIEVKSSKRITNKDVKSLKILKEEQKLKKIFLVSQDPDEQYFENIEALPYQTFLKKLWDGDVY